MLQVQMIKTHYDQLNFMEKQEVADTLVLDNILYSCFSLLSWL